VQSGKFQLSPAKFLLKEQRIIFAGQNVLFYRGCVVCVQKEALALLPFTRRHPANTHAGSKAHLCMCGYHTVTP